MRNGRMRRIVELLKWKKPGDILGGIKPMRTASGQILQQVADNGNLEAAFQWLMDNSQEYYHHNNEVWDFRRQWPAHKERLANQLRQGEYQFQTVSIVEAMNDDGSRCQRETLTPQDKLVVSAIAQVLQPALQACLSTDCAAHGNGGVEGCVARTQSYVASNPESHCMKSDIQGYYAHVSHTVLMEQLSCLFPNEPALCRLIMEHLRRTVEWGGNYKEIKQGLPLGSALSPILGAIYHSPLDALFAGWKDGFYQRFMDDWIIIQSKRHDLRKTIKRVYTVLHTLGLRIAQDKTYFGLVSKGFDFLGFHCCPTDMTVSAAALLRRDQKIARLYEQGASKERVGAYLRRWLGWAGVGVMIVLSGCKELKTDIGPWDYYHVIGTGGYIFYVNYSEDYDIISYNNKRVLVKKKDYVEINFKENEKREITMQLETDELEYIEPTYYKCGELIDKFVAKYKCECYGDPNRYKGCLKEEGHSKRINKLVDVGCGANPSCLVIKRKYGVLEKYYRKSVDEYVEIIKKIRENEESKPDEKLNVK